MLLSFIQHFAQVTAFFLIYKTPLNKYTEKYCRKFGSKRNIIKLYLINIINLINLPMSIYSIL